MDIFRFNNKGNMKEKFPTIKVTIKSQALSQY